jgi:transposase
MRVEQIADLPLLADQIQRCDLSNLLDEYFPDHGLWKGISGGQVGVGWLLYILSEGDHRLSHVEDWADLHIRTLKILLGVPKLRSIDFCDDRLGRLLDRYSDATIWYNFEQALGKRLLQIYPLPTLSNVTESAIPVIRTDSFNAPQFRPQGELFTHGYSKQRRSDQPFCKVMVSSLDSLAMPLAVEIVKGSGPDVNHYLPIINRVRATLKTSGNLYVGDSQLGSLPNRLEITQNGDYYLCPLHRKQCSVEQLHTYLHQMPWPIEELPSLFTEEGATRKPVYFHEISEMITAPEGQWQERRLLVYSPEYAKGLVTSFNNRIAEAEVAIMNLVISKTGRRNPKTLKALHGRIAGILNKYGVDECFEIYCSQTQEYRAVQRYKDRPAEQRKEVTLHLNIKRKEDLIKLKQQRLGWQIYATNAPRQLISAPELVRNYRNEYRIEHLFDYFINRDVGLLPIYLKKESRVKGLIRLLSLAMRFCTLIQHQARTELATKKGKIKGIYPGNKGRKTANPTSPMILRAFRGIAVVWIKSKDGEKVQMTELCPNQKKNPRISRKSRPIPTIFDAFTN